VEVVAFGDEHGGGGALILSKNNDARVHIIK
jgi:hypothetical protein